jgi:hypothetical protein
MLWCIYIYEETLIKKIKKKRSYKRVVRILIISLMACLKSQGVTNNSFPRGQNHTFIALIPKLSGSHSTHQFRPISLCNIIYKIISKILATRLKIYLPKIISPLQSTFVPKRNIQDKTILAHELLHSFKSRRGNGGYMFLKMDMEKAFDRME